MKKEYKNILNNYIIDHKGGADRHDVRGAFGISYNDMLDYIGIYKIEVLDTKKGYRYINDQPLKLSDDNILHDYCIKEIFFQGSEEYAEIIGGNFLNNSSDTQFKKVRAYFKEYDY